VLTINGTTLPALPHQERFGNLNVRFPAMFGGYGCGKSHIALRKGTWASYRWPGVTGIYCCLTYPLLRDAILPEFFRILGSLGLSEGIDYTFHWSSMTWTNLGARDPSTGENSKILFRPVEGPRNLARIIAITAGWGILDEADKMGSKVHQAVSARIRDIRCKRPFLASVGTPEGLQNCYGQYVSEPRDRGWQEDEQYRYVRGRTMDNPHLDPGYVDSLFQMYDDHLVQAYLEGHFVPMFEGLCFRFKEHEHVSEKAEYSNTLPILWSWDFNVNPMSTTFWHRNGDWIWAFDEIVLPTSHTDEVCEEFLSGQYSEHLAGLHIHGDSGGNQRRSQAGDALRGHWTDYDIIREKMAGIRGFYEAVPAANPRQRDSTNAVNSKLRNGEGQVRVAVNPRCKNLIRSLLSTHWDESSNPSKIYKGPDADEHCSDTARYVIAELFPVSESVRRKRQTAARKTARRKVG